MVCDRKSKCVGIVPRVLGALDTPTTFGPHCNKNLKAEIICLNISENRFPCPP